MQRIRSSRLARSWLIAWLAIAPLPCLAQQKFVYLVDINPPERVFTAAMTPSGTNLNIFDLVAHTRDEGFLVTVDSMDSARWVAEDIMSRSDLGRIFIYRIRADEHFYSFNLSVQRLWEVAREMNARWTFPFILRWLEGVDWMRMHITDRIIPPSAIASAIEISRPDSLPHTPTVMHAAISNDRYIDADTQASLEAYGEQASVEPRFRPSPNSSCRPTRPFRHDDNDDHEGAIGLTCEDDVLAVESPYGYVPLSVIPDCAASRRRRSLSQPPCKPLPTINLSRRARALNILILDWTWSPSNGRHDEL
jgi:hypothetical protein